MPTYLLKDSFTEGVGNTMHVNSTYTKVMQTFTASENYTLVRIGVFIGAYPFPQDVSGGIYSVSNGLPNSLLESFTMDVTAPSSPGEELFTLLDSPLELSSGVQYAIVFDWSGGVTSVTLFGDRNFDSDKYAGGEWLAYRLSTTTWENPYGSGYVDMYFKTYSASVTRQVILSSPSNGATDLLLPPFLIEWSISGSGPRDPDPFEDQDFLFIYMRKDDANFTEDNLIGNFIQAFYNDDLQIDALTTPVYGSTYYWQVQAGNTAGDLDDSEVWSFTMLDLLPPVVSGGEATPTGENNMMTIKRLVVAARNRIYYETL